MDALDEAIVAHLTVDGRASFAACGEAVGLSPSAVKRRVDALVAAGTIRGFTVVVDPSADRPVTEAFVELYCRGEASPTEIGRLAETHDAVIAAYTVTGDADALVHLRTGTIAELEAVIEKIRSSRDVERTKSIIVLSRLVDRNLSRPTP
jgi:DNA-binding Lrp family transcriptional regulator